MSASAPALKRNTDFWQKPSARDTALILMCFTMPKAEDWRKWDVNAVDAREVLKQFL